MEVAEGRTENLRMDIDMFAGTPPNFFYEVTVVLSTKYAEVTRIPLGVITFERTLRAQILGPNAGYHDVRPLEVIEVNCARRIALPGHSCNKHLRLVNEASVPQFLQLASEDEVPEWLIVEIIVEEKTYELGERFPLLEDSLTFAFLRVRIDEGAQPGDDPFDIQVRIEQVVTS
tara:strand:+ start:11144 stop:11665 length:522 start_codon:yes stop_codon:yes gene_type:complete